MIGFIFFIILFNPTAILRKRLSLLQKENTEQKDNKFGLRGEAEQNRPKVVKKKKYFRGGKIPIAPPWEKEVAIC